MPPQPHPKARRSTAPSPPPTRRVQTVPRPVAFLLEPGHPFQPAPPPHPPAMLALSSPPRVQPNFTLFLLSRGLGAHSRAVYLWPAGGDKDPMPGLARGWGSGVWNTGWRGHTWQGGVGGGTARPAQRADKRQAVPATSCPALNAARSSPTRREPSGSSHPGAGTRDQGPERRTSVHTRGPSPSARVRTPAPRGEVSRQPLAFGSIQGGRWGQRAGQGSAPGVGRSREKRLGPRCEVCGSVSHLPEEGFTWNKPQPLELPGPHPSASSQL